MTAYTPELKNIVEITLSHTVSEINALLNFTQKFKMVTKYGGKTILGGKVPFDSAYTLGSNNFVEMGLSHFFHFHR